MPRRPIAIRILPMSDKTPGFVGRDIENVQRTLFLREMVRTSGRFHYPSTGLLAEPGTLVLFQYRARIIATATFLRDERFAKAKRGFAGALHFDATSIRTFDPLDVDAMRTIWPSFRGFGHVKQHLNPECYRLLHRRLKNVAAPRAVD